MTIRERMHESHEILTNETISNERFATRYTCNRCGAEACTATGSNHIDAEFEAPCEYGDRHAYLEHRISALRKQLEAYERELSCLSMFRCYAAT